MKTALIALVWLIAAGWCVLVTACPRIASATYDEADVITGACAGLVTGWLLWGRRASG